jgi:hypothetical protein
MSGVWYNPTDNSIVGNNGLLGHGISAIATGTGALVNGASSVANNARATTGYVANATGNIGNTVLNSANNAFGAINPFKKKDQNTCDDPSHRAWPGCKHGGNKKTNKKRITRNNRRNKNKKIGGFQPRTASRSASAINRKKSKKNSIVSFPI